MRPTSLVLASCLAATLLTGCSISTTAAPGGASGGGLTGKVHGGQQPILGAKVYLLQAATSGYNNASVSLLNSGSVGSAPYGGGTDSVGSYVLTGAGGFFDISGDYTCATGAQVYVYVSGGDSGSGSSNSAIGLLATLGECPAGGNFAATVPFIWVNEVTTVASGYAMAGFSSSATQVSAPSADTTNHPRAKIGLQNAFANAASLADISNGTANTIVPGNANSIVPRASINTLANILAACVNTSSPGSANCTSLFSVATADGTQTGTQPTNTATALINIAHFPGSDPNDLCALQSGVSAPFQPNITCDADNNIPNDFTLPIAFTDAGLFNNATAVAIDAAGNAWVATTGNLLGTNLITKVSPTGQNLAADGSPFTDPGTGSDPATGPHPQAIAIDPSGNAWMGNQGDLSSANGSVSVLPTPHNYTGAAMRNVGAIAVDGRGFIWAGSQAGGPTFGSVAALYGSNAGTFGHTQGDFVSATPYTSGGVSTVDGLAVDGLGYVWTANGPSSAGGVSVLYGSNAPGGSGTSTGDAVPGSPFATSTLIGPAALAVDQNGFIWAIDANFSPGSAAQIYGTNASGGHNAGDLYAPAYQPTSLVSPSAIAVDGASNIWITNLGASNITGLYGSNASGGHSPGDPISPVSEEFIGGYTGYTGAPDFFSMQGPVGIAVDPSGNLWIADNSQLVEFIGIATPVATPIPANLTAPYNQPASKP